MGQKIRVVHHSQVEFCLKSVLDHSECMGKYCRWCTTLAFGTMIGHVKINYGPENQGCTPFTG